MSESWLPLREDSNYEVSNLGNMRSWKPYRNGSPKPTEPRVMHIFVNPEKGYRLVRLFIDGKRFNGRVARLVLATWIPEGSGVTRHLNGDQTDDRLVNLAWGTPKQNSEDARLHGTQTCGDRSVSKLNAAKVREIRNSKLPTAVLAIQFSVSVKCIRKIKRGETWHGC